MTAQQLGGANPANRGTLSTVAAGAELTTERLHLRPLRVPDAEHLVALHGDAEVMRYLGRPRTRQQVLDEDLDVARIWADHPYGYWLAHAGGTVLGWFLLRGARPGRPPDPRGLELGYRLHRTAWGHGYATEGSRALLDHAFADPAVDRVWATTMEVNRGSRRVMDKVGLRHVRTFHVDWPDPLPGSEHGEVEYAITRAQWADQAGPAAAPAP